MLKNPSYNIQLHHKQAKAKTDADGGNQQP